MPDFSFPEWMLRQNTFADSLAKGAQVGAAIANARYRNQALAAEVMQSEREYALREKQLSSQQRTADLNFQLQSQLVEDQASDKEKITKYIQTISPLPLEERLLVESPALTLPQSYEVINKIKDNNRLAFQQSLKGKIESTIALKLGKIDTESAQEYLNEPDPIRRKEILAKAEAVAAARAEALRAVAPTIAAETRKEIAEMQIASREHLAELKSEAVSARSYGVTEQSFVSRNLKTLLDSMALDKEHRKKSISERTQIATELLQKSYRDSESKPTSAINPSSVPSAKADLANKLAAEHPDWDRARIISEVNKQLP